MSRSTPITAATLKRTLKEVFAETLEEQRDLLRDAVVEAIEDMAMTKAIKAGRRTRPVSRSQVTRALKGRA